MIVPWEIFLLCCAAIVEVVWVVRPDLVFVMRGSRKTICVSVLIYY